jgi:hypothetical protein
VRAILWPLMLRRVSERAWMGIVGGRLPMEES